MQFSYVFYRVELQLIMNLTVSNAQMSLNELNKSRGMLVRNLFGKEKRRNKCRGRRKGFERKERDRIPKTKKKNNIGNNIMSVPNGMTQEIHICASL
jgi:hypothetical protein